MNLSKKSLYTSGQYLIKPLFTFLFVLVSVFVRSQNATLKGHVTTSDGKAAEFVNVVLKGTNKGTIADANGYYELTNLKAGNYTLQASFVGLAALNKKITLASGQTLEENLELTSNSQQLQQVVVMANPSKYVTDYPSISLRLKTPLLELPQNIQVITGQTLKDQQIFDMQEGVIRNVSGATRAEHWENYARIVMRGSRVAAFRNGMNVTETWGPLNEDMSMVERIEFVKGPAGFMLASGEPSGFYNVVTQKPIYGRIQDAKFADKIFRMNYDIHVGAIWGLTGKILAFFVSLMAASLPITGFYI